MDFLERIQSKPRGVKTRYAILTAGFITGAIALVWMSTIPARFAEVALNTSKEGETEKPSLGELMNDTKSQLGNVIESIDGVKEEQVPETNMDALSMPVAGDTTGSALGETLTPEPNAVPSTTATSTTSSETSMPVLTDKQETHQVLETQTGSGKTILIGTTTSSQ
jgi:hypothetical protein